MQASAPKGLLFGRSVHRSIESEANRETIHMTFEIIGSESRYTNPEAIKVRGSLKRACEIARKRTTRRWFTASVYHVNGGYRSATVVSYRNGRKVND